VEPTDADLIARFLVYEDEDAFTELVRRHQSAVRGLLRKLACGDHAWADDLAQETFLRAYRSLSSFRGGSLPGWLYRIAYHAFIDASRRLHPADEPPDEGPGATLQSERAALLTRDLEVAMKSLRPEERAAIALTYGRGLSHEEAAEALAWPLGTLKTHVARGKARLARLLVDWEEEA
jgi:RNA polymerase sigma factor (sigma-70 family)